MPMSRPISVLNFCCEPVRGGAEEHMLMLLRNLDRRLFRLQLVCLPEIAEQLGPDLPPDVELVPLSYTSPAQMSGAVQFGKILRQRRPDVLHSHMFRASLAASPVAWLCRVPVVLETAHVREVWRKGFKSNYFVDRLTGRFVDDYIAVSRATAQYLTEEKRLPRRKITVIQNGCNLTNFHPEHSPPADLRVRLGFEESDPVLVVAARLEPQKGHRVLLEALPAVIREFPNVKLVCVGDGQLREQLEGQSRVLGLTLSVRFVGHQSNVSDWLALAEFTVLPSYYEGLPLTAIESLAAGRTVVATAVDGTPEVVVDGKTGLTVPPGDPPQLSEAIIRLLRQPDLRRNLAAAGRQWVIDQFSHTRQVRATEELYVRALERSRRGPVVWLHRGTAEQNGR